MKLIQGTKVEVRVGTSRWQKDLIVNKTFQTENCERLPLYDILQNREFIPLRSKCQLRIIAPSGKKIIVDYDSKEENWDYLREKINISKIDRLPWKKILGKTLVDEILLLEKQGLTPSETYDKLISKKEIKQLLRISNAEKRQEIKDRIKNSTSARFAEINRDIQERGKMGEPDQS
jgi:hypothetical protein